MTHPSVIEGSALISALARFATLVLQGKIPPTIRPLFFGASLIALAKKDDGVRPIAVGCTLRRLAAKVASLKVRDEMAALLAPHQLGYGVRGGAEAAVHAARLYVRDLEQRCVLKLDFKNAFNTLRMGQDATGCVDLHPCPTTLRPLILFCPFLPLLG